MLVDYHLVHGKKPTNPRLVHFHKFIRALQLVGYPWKSHSPQIINCPFTNSRSSFKRAIPLYIEAIGPIREVACQLVGLEQSTQFIFLI